MLVIGRFVVQGELGRGGMGVVYEAHDPKLRRSVAVKLLRGSGATKVKRFAREASALARLRHPNLVCVHEVGEHQGQPYLVMDLVRGQSLEARIAEGPLPEAEAVELTRQLALALVHVHEQQLIHRDVKPANVVIDEAGRPHLTDFGLAKDLDPARSGSLTADGTFLGTAGFLAPEQARGQPIGPAVDVHGLGATLYAMLTQQTPYSAGPTLEAVLAGFDQPPTPPSRIRPGIHSRLDQLVLAMLTPTPRQRPTAAAVAGALRSYREAARAHTEPAEGREQARPVKQATIVGRYVVLEELGRGAMGVVLRAYDSRYKRHVAIKLLGGSLLPAQRQRFAREAETLSRLHHPNVVELLDTGNHEGRPFVVLELASGQTLDERLHALGPLDPEEVIRLGADLAGALAAAHALGVVHRDVKPNNVLIDAEGRPLLADFGLVKDLSRVDNTERLTQTGRLFGTPGFWSPEQAAGLPDVVGPPTDVYSLGATLHMLLTGEPLFEVAGLLEAAIAAREWTPRSVRADRPEVPADLDALLLRCLAKEPHERPTSSELARLLESVRANRTGSSWTLRAVALASALALGGVGLATGLANTPDPVEEAPEAPTETPTPSAPELPSALELYARARDAEDAGRAKEALTNYRWAAEAGHAGAMLRLGHLRSGAKSATSKNLAEAFRWYQKSAARGNAVAMDAVAKSYAAGRGVAPSGREAIRWFLKSGQAGHAEAFWSLGKLFLSGATGITKSEDKALQHFRKAVQAGEPRAAYEVAELLSKRPNTAAEVVRYLSAGVQGGDVRAMLRLALFHEEGLAGLERNLPAAARLYREAIRRGESKRACGALGEMYEDGRGVDKNLREAIRLYELGAKQGDPLSSNNLALLYEAGRGVPADHDKARRLYERAADGGMPTALYNLARAYRDGVGGKPDPSRGRAVFERAAQAGSAEAHYYLGELLEAGRGLKQSYYQAAQRYQKAADLGHAPGLTKLGLLLEKGLGAKQDYRAAASYYQAAAKRGDPHAMTRLAYLHQKGLGVERNPNRAVGLLEAAHKGGDFSGLTVLGRAYEEGNGVDQSLEKAARAYRDAVSHGLPEGTASLERLLKAHPELR